MRRLSFGAPAFFRDEFDPERPREAGGDLVLHLEQVFARLVESIGPDVRAGLRVDQLRVDPHALCAALDAALQNVAHPQGATDLADVDGATLERERRIAGDDKDAGNPREIRRQAFRHAVDEIVLFLVAAEFVKGSTAIDRRGAAFPPAAEGIVAPTDFASSAVE